MNKRIILVGGGASVRQGQWNKPVADLELWNLLKTEATMSLNYAFRYFNSTLNTFHDETFYRSNLSELKNVPLIFGKYARNVEDVIMPNTYLIKGLSDYHENQWKIGFYASNLVGVFALSIAINLGYKEIFLLGYDFGMIDGEHTHFYQDEVDSTEKDCNFQLKYRGFGKKEIEPGKIVHCTSNYEFPSDYYFAPFKQHLKECTILNVGKDSRLDTFEKIDYDTFYNLLKIAPSNINQEDERRAIETYIMNQRKT